VVIMARLVIQRSAIVSPCARYRYRLARRWGAGEPVVWIMLNPSAADATADDPTIRKCIGFTARLGHAALIVVNLFAYRATDPNDMRAAADPVGPANDAHIAAAARSGALTICAWGRHGTHRARDQQVLAWLREQGIEPVALHINNDGTPGHPLPLPYLRATARFALA
jgi:hypothetical protein